MRTHPKSIQRAFYISNPPEYKESYPQGPLYLLSSNLFVSLTNVSTNVCGRMFYGSFKYLFMPPYSDHQFN